MRKRMSRMKKEMAVAVAAAMCISLVGCGGGSSKKVVADKKEAVETTVAETTETEEATNPAQIMRSAIAPSVNV